MNRIAKSLLENLPIFTAFEQSNSLLQRVSWNPALHHEDFPLHAVRDGQKRIAESYRSPRQIDTGCQYEQLGAK